MSLQTGRWLLPYCVVAWLAGGQSSALFGQDCSALEGLPKPIIRFADNYDSNAAGAWYTYYQIPVINWSDYPDSLFALSPDLPPCGSNTNASRTWANIRDGSGNFLYGFCGLTGAGELTDLWFALPRGTAPPEQVRVELVDRRCSTTHASGLISLRTREGGTRGLFVGSYEGWHYGLGFLPNDAWGDAQRLHAALDRYVHFTPVTDVSVVMRLDYDGDDNSDTIRAALREIGRNTADRDVFVFYYSGHGATDTGDIQALSVGHDGDIWDSELAQWLRDYFPAGASKIVILDSCYSGGFWPEALEDVPNTILMASAGQEDFSLRYPTVQAIYGSKLVEGLQATSKGSQFAKADTDEDGLTFKELHDWANDQMLSERATWAGQDLPVSDLVVARGWAEWQTVGCDYAGGDLLVFGAPPENSRPVANAGADLFVDLGAQSAVNVLLSGEMSFDPDADELSYSWRYLGDEVGTGSTLSIRLAAGVHQLELIVDDGRISSDPDRVTVIVQRQSARGVPQLRIPGALVLVALLALGGSLAIRRA